MKEVFKTSVNAYGVKVKHCCASCASKHLEGETCERICKKFDMEVESGHVCEEWAMSALMKSVGVTQGRVKRKEYQEFLVKVREGEAKDKKMGKEVIPKSIEYLRIQFEEEHGSVYM